MSITNFMNVVGKQLGPSFLERQLLHQKSIVNIGYDHQYALRPSSKSTSDIKNRKITCTSKAPKEEEKLEKESQHNKLECSNSQQYCPLLVSKVFNFRQYSTSVSDLQRSVQSRIDLISRSAMDLETCSERQILIRRLREVFDKIRTVFAHKPKASNFMKKLIYRPKPYTNVKKTEATKPGFTPKRTYSTYTKPNLRSYYLNTRKPGLKHTLKLRTKENENLWRNSTSVRGNAYKFQVTCKVGNNLESELAKRNSGTILTPCFRCGKPKRPLDGDILNSNDLEGCTVRFIPIKQEAAGGENIVLNVTGAAGENEYTGRDEHSIDSSTCTGAKKDTPKGKEGNCECCGQPMPSKGKAAAKSGSKPSAAQIAAQKLDKCVAEKAARKAKDAKTKNTKGDTHHDDPCKPPGTIKHVDKKDSHADKRDAHASKEDPCKPPGTIKHVDKKDTHADKKDTHASKEDPCKPPGTIKHVDKKDTHADKKDTRASKEDPCKPPGTIKHVDKKDTHAGTKDTSKEDPCKPPGTIKHADKKDTRADKKDAHASKEDPCMEAPKTGTPKKSDPHSAAPRAAAPKVETPIKGAPKKAAAKPAAASKKAAAKPAAAPKKASAKPAAAPKKSSAKPASAPKKAAAKPAAAPKKATEKPAAAPKKAAAKPSAAPKKAAAKPAAASKKAAAKPAAAPKKAAAKPAAAPKKVAAKPDAAPKKAAAKPAAAPKKAAAKLAVPAKKGAAKPAAALKKAPVKATAPKKKEDPKKAAKKEAPKKAVKAAAVPKSGDASKKDTHKEDPCATDKPKADGSKKPPTLKTDPLHKKKKPSGPPCFPNEKSKKEEKARSKSDPSHTKEHKDDKSKSQSDPCLPSAKKDGKARSKSDPSLSKEHKDGKSRSKSDPKADQKDDPCAQLAERRAKKAEKARSNKEDVCDPPKADKKDEKSNSHVDPCAPKATERKAGKKDEKSKSHSDPCVPKAARRDEKSKSHSNDPKAGKKDAKPGDKAAATKKDAGDKKLTENKCFKLGDEAGHKPDRPENLKGILGAARKNEPGKSASQKDNCPQLADLDKHLKSIEECLKKVASTLEKGEKKECKCNDHKSSAGSGGDGVCSKKDCPFMAKLPPEFLECCKSKCGKIKSPAEQMACICQQCSKFLKKDQNKSTTCDFKPSNLASEAAIESCLAPEPIANSIEDLPAAADSFLEQEVEQPMTQASEYLTGFPNEVDSAAVTEVEPQQLAKAIDEEELQLEKEDNIEEASRHFEILNQIEQNILARKELERAAEAINADIENDFSREEMERSMVNSEIVISTEDGAMGVAARTFEIEHSTILPRELQGEEHSMQTSAAETTREELDSSTNPETASAEDDTANRHGAERIFESEANNLDKPRKCCCHKRKELESDDSNYHWQKASTLAGKPGCTSSKLRCSCTPEDYTATTKSLKVENDQQRPITTITTTTTTHEVIQEKKQSYDQQQPLAACTSCGWLPFNNNEGKTSFFHREINHKFPVREFHQSSLSRSLPKLSMLNDVRYFTSAAICSVTGSIRSMSVSLMSFNIFNYVSTGNVLAEETHHLPVEALSTFEPQTCDCDKKACGLKPPEKKLKRCACGKPLGHAGECAPAMQQRCKCGKRLNHVGPCNKIVEAKDVETSQRATIAKMNCLCTDSDEEGITMLITIPDSHSLVSEPRPSPQPAAKGSRVGCVMTVTTI